MTDAARLKVFLVDDEPLALKRLAHLLAEIGHAEIIGQETDPSAALTTLATEPWREHLDALFLDIQMPEMNGFELLAKLDWQPLVVFTTAFDEYALRAFEVNSIDYLLKPIERMQLERALQKLERRVAAPPADFRSVIEQLAAAMQPVRQSAPTRIASRLGERVRFIELTQITHFYAHDKLTYAAATTGDYVVDRSITELEQELSASQFIRIHRAILLNTEFVEEVRSWFGGRLVVRLKDGKRTELTVARDRVKELRDRLGF
ncbi:MAG TPA: LytTR family DNA-binding domain-containing protein [Blastocatellia bacterium]|nr:LytTR family DNA-binding domain-containing protein [Blastocatellia bacterium]